MKSYVYCGLCSPKQLVTSECLRASVIVIARSVSKESSNRLQKHSTYRALFAAGWLFLGLLVCSAHVSGCVCIAADSPVSFYPGAFSYLISGGDRVCYRTGPGVAVADRCPETMCQAMQDIEEYPLPAQITILYNHCLPSEKCTSPMKYLLQQESAAEAAPVTDTDFLQLLEIHEQAVFVSQNFDEAVTIFVCQVQSSWLVALSVPEGKSLNERKLAEAFREIALLAVYEEEFTCTDKWLILTLENRDIFINIEGFSGTSDFRPFKPKIKILEIKSCKSVNKRLSNLEEVKQTREQGAHLQEGRPETMECCHAGCDPGAGEVNVPATKQGGHYTVPGMCLLPGGGASKNRKTQKEEDGSGRMTGQVFTTDSRGSAFNTSSQSYTNNLFIQPFGDMSLK